LDFAFAFRVIATKIEIGSSVSMQSGFSLFSKTKPPSINKSNRLCTKIAEKLEKCGSLHEVRA
jgi:hypothetical protein